MAGSSGMLFARVAAATGWSPPPARALGRGPLALPAAGRTDEQTDAVLEVARELSPASPARRSPGWAPSCWRGSCRGSTRRCSTRSTPTRTRAGHLHRQRRRQRPGRDARPGARHGGRDRDPLRGRRGRQLHREHRRPFVYGEGKVEAMRRFADRARDRPRRLLRLLGLGLGPADAARGRQPGGRQPRPAAGRDRQGRGLAGDALRAARPPAGDRRSRSTAAGASPARRAARRRRRPQRRAASPGAAAAGARMQP